MPSKVKFVSSEELEAMHTGTLMKRRSALLECEESFECSDRNGYENLPESASTGLIEFKDTDEWRQAYDELKNVLTERENVPSKQERKSVRQLNAKASK